MAPSNLDSLRDTYEFMNLDRNLRQAYRLHCLFEKHKHAKKLPRKAAILRIFLDFFDPQGASQDLCDNNVVLPSLRSYSKELFTFLRTGHFKRFWHHPIIKTRTHAIEHPSAPTPAPTRPGSWFDSSYFSTSTRTGSYGGGYGAGYSLAPTPTRTIATTTVGFGGGCGGSIGTGHYGGFSHARKDALDNHAQFGDPHYKDQEDDEDFDEDLGEDFDQDFEEEDFEEEDCNEDLNQEDCPDDTRGYDDAYEDDCQEDADNDSFDDTCEDDYEDDYYTY
ncbi:uncharacterized protein BKA78DRAFT_319747 [Phyllosticta capitalensis]|uniref:uncharacterized protein n=1 Tax=Phyllosticta capitalensis TaxID=121624 RepID=UPI0031318C0A